MKPNLILCGLALALAGSAFAQTAGPTNATPKSSAGLEATLQKVEREWAEAVQRRDVESIARIEADEYEFVGPEGNIWTRSRALDAIRSGDLVIDSFEISELQVRVYDQTAVVRFRIIWNGRFRDTDISGPQRMTDVFVKRDGRWQCVASQSTRINAP
jgi:ketosteroid isomerase-like protein